MNEKIYVIGHKSPDLDSVASAISYANLKNKIENTDIYIPAIAEEVNKETAYVLDKFKISKPELLTDAKGKKVIQVDHNEFSQAVNGIEEAEIVEVLDHHKVVYNYAEPIPFKVLPWGATASIVAEIYLEKNISLEKNIAGLLMSAILVDTVICKSPTCTNRDVELLKKLSNISGINNWEEFGMELFKIRSSVQELKNSEIIKSDFKDFLLKSGKFGIGQVETVDLSEFNTRHEQLIQEMEKIRTEGNYHSVILFITDIIKEGSLFLVSSKDLNKVEDALGAKLENNKVYIDGVISRKKQVAPKFNEVFDK